MNIYFTLQLILFLNLLCKGLSPQQYYSLVGSSNYFMLKFVMLSDAFDIVAVTSPHVFSLSLERPRHILPRN